MGLLDKAQQPNAQQQQQQPPQQGRPQEQQQRPPQQANQPQQGGQSQQGGKDQQEVYERIATMALDYVYSDQGSQMVLDGLRMKNGDMVKNAGNVVAKIITRLIIAARTAGGSIPPKVMLQVGMETALAVLELAEVDSELPNAEGGMLDAVFYAAVTIVGNELPEDMLSTQERQEIRQTLEQVAGMSQGQQPQQGRPQQPPQQGNQPQQGGQMRPQQPQQRPQQQGQSQPARQEMAR